MENWKDKTWLFEQFQEGKSLEDVAKETGKHINTIRYWANRLGVKPLGSKMTVKDGLRPLDINKLPELINEAGGISKWAQGEAIEIYAFLKNLAYDAANDGDRKEAAKITKALDKIIEFIPSRSRRNTDDYVKRVDPEDRQVVNQLNELLVSVKNDTHFGNTDEGWYGKGERVPVKLPHA